MRYQLIASTFAPDVAGLRHVDRKPFQEVWIVVRGILCIVRRGDVAWPNAVRPLL